MEKKPEHIKPFEAVALSRGVLLHINDVAKLNSDVQKVKSYGKGGLVDAIKHRGGIYYTNGNLLSIDPEYTEESSNGTGVVPEAITEDEFSNKGSGFSVD